MKGNILSVMLNCETQGRLAGSCGFLAEGQKSSVIYPLSPTQHRKTMALHDWNMLYETSRHNDQPPLNSVTKLPREPVPSSGHISDYPASVQ